MSKKKSLRKYILQFLVIFLVTVIVIIGGVSLYEQYQQRVKEVKYNQLLVLKQVDEELTKLTSKMEFLKEYLSLNYGTNGNILKYLVKTNDDILSIAILDKNGIVKDHYTHLNYNIYKGFDYSTKDYFKALKTKESTYSKIYLSTKEDIPILPYSFKMEEKVVFIAIDLTNFSKFLNRFKNYDQTYMIKIFNKDGLLIIDPTVKSRLVENYNAKPSEVFTKLIHSAKPFEQVIYKGVKTEKLQLGSYFKVKDIDWYIVVRNEHDFILKSLASMFISYLITIFIMIFISIYITLKITRKIFKSFDEIESITSNIANGNYDVELKDLYFDEFNKLLLSFNKMQHEIDKREETLANSLDSFKSLFNSTMESVILHKDGICFDVNDVSIKFFNASSKNDLIGKSIIDLVAQKDKAIVRENFNINSEPYEVELNLIDGTTIQALIQGKVIELDGKVINIAAIIDISELKEKDKLIFHQSKLAAMGEMIENIAHHWRQPLSIISTGATGIKIQKEHGILSDEMFNKTCDKIDEQAQYLSKTIDDFRDYIQGNTKEFMFNLKSTIEDFKKLAIGTVEKENIQIISTIDETIETMGYPNELIQCLITILNNSKDAFIANEIDRNKRYIFLEQKQDMNTLQIIFKDNAGGIPENIISKIFEPYFTTKHKAQGVGLGLHMTYNIVTDHMKGDIKVSNVEFEYKDHSYRGAQFIISIPLS